MFRPWLDLKMGYTTVETGSISRFAHRAGLYTPLNRLLPVLKSPSSETKSSYASAAILLN